jgi:hypothetical protein
LKHPRSITHHGIEYTLSHLAENTGRFSWRILNGREVTFSIKTTFSDHCYSDKNLPRQYGCHVVTSRGGQRIFCTERYERSLSLPALMEGLLTEPTSTVCLTAQRNYMLVCIVMKPPLPTGHRYYVFFNMKSQVVEISANDLAIQCHVESAYTKSTTVPFKRRLPFGRLAEEVVFGKR